MTVLCIMSMQRVIFVSLKSKWFLAIVDKRETDMGKDWIHDLNKRIDSLERVSYCSHRWSFRSTYIYHGSPDLACLEVECSKCSLSDSKTITIEFYNQLVNAGLHIK